MRKILALTLALVLALGLCAPALAAETDGTYYVDGQPVDTYPVEETPPMDEEYTYVDPYAEYEAAHPEEIAALDVDALIAGWGYKDMTAAEAFLEDRWEGTETDSLEEAVRMYYIAHRVRVEESREEAASSKEEYPEAWATFDAESYFNYQFTEYYDYETDKHLTLDKAGYMARENILTEEEFVDCMFADYAYYLDWRDPNWWVKEEPSLKLVVNGVVSEAAISVSDGVSYADAADLRSILGDAAVAANATGSVAIRPAAEAAGWDVQWYDDWGRQEVQLWNKTAFQAEVAEEFEAYEDFAARLAEQNKVWLETAGELNETLELKLTRFDTLDGDRTYTAKAKVEAVMEDGVMDCVINVDAAGFGALLDVARQAGWSVEDAVVAQMKKTMGDVKVEMIADLEEGEAAYRVPTLALLDPELANWQSLELGGSAETVISSHDSVLEAGYQTMLKNAATMGGVYAWDSATEDMERQVATLGADRFTTAADGTVTYTLITQDMEESGYKRCEVRCVMKPDGWYTLELDMRPDLMSSILGSAEYLDEEELFQVLVYDLLGSFFDMEAAVKLEVNRDSATASVEFHWSNMGKLEFGGTARRSAADRHPRQVKDVLPLTVESTPGTILTNAS